MHIYDLNIMKLVKQKRKELGFTTDHIARVIKTSRSFINNIESTKSRNVYNIDHLARIAYLFKCNIKDLLPVNETEIFEKEELKNLDEKLKIIWERAKKRLPLKSAILD